MSHLHGQVKQRSVLIDIARVVRVAHVEMDDELRQVFRESRADVIRLRDFAHAFDRLLEELEGQDKLGNFEIQDLMSRYNEAETLASNVAKKSACVADNIIQKI